MAFDAVTEFSGIIVRVKYPDLQPELAYIRMVLENLPTGLKSLFIIGLFGAIISTLDSYYLIGGTTLAKDIYMRIFPNSEISDMKLVNMSRAGSCLLGLMGLGLAFRFTLVYDAIAFFSSLWMSTGFVAVLMALMYKGRKTPAAGLLSMIAGCLVFAWLKMNPIIISESFGELEPLLVALPVSFIAWCAGNQFGVDKSQSDSVIRA
jgi:SSS family solute:Na+ symporter